MGDLLVARAGPRDARDLSRFECARPGVWYDAQVQRFVRTAFLVGPPLSQVRHYEPLVLREDGDLMGVAAIRQWAEAPAAGGTELVVGALALSCQGRVRQDGEPYAGLLMRTLLQAARDGAHGPFVSAIVAIENTRSRNMCARAGLVHELRHDDDHLRLVGVLPA